MSHYQQSSGQFIFPCNVLCKLHREIVFKNICFFAQTLSSVCFLLHKEVAKQPRPERNELLECFAINKRRICRTLNTSLTENSMLDALFSFWKAGTEYWMFCVPNISMRITKCELKRMECDLVAVFAYVCYRFVFCMRLISNGFYEIRIIVLSHTHTYTLKLTQTNTAIHMQASDTVFHLVWLLFVLFILICNRWRFVCVRWWFRSKSRDRYTIFISVILSGHIFACIGWFWWHSLPLWRTSWVALWFYQ